MTNRDLTDVESVRARVDAVLAQRTEVVRAHLAAISVDALALAEPLEQLLTGGKRLRAALCYWSWRMHGGSADGPAAETVIRVAAALELFQAAALFHDDVIDDSDRRRGVPTAHRSLADLHRASQWRGSSDRFGAAAAILLGDLCLVASEEEFSIARAGLDDAAFERARETFSEMRTEVTIGQFLDVRAQALPFGDDPAADLERARTVIRAKAARYSVEHPVVIGAALAGASAEQLDRCRAFGLPLGEAFQLRDDLLGVFGEPATTGKPAGDDLREGKRTVLVALTMQRADPADRAVVAARLGDPALTADDVAHLRRILLGSGAVAGVESLIATLRAEAMAVLATVEGTSPGTEMMGRLAHALVDRAA